MARSGDGVWDGAQYQERFDALAARGMDVHGEADFVTALAPRTVLDAGCGSGRVARELAARGFEVIGVDNEPSMIAEAQRRSPDLDWRVADLAGFALEHRFDVVVMAGNVLLFTQPGTNAAVVSGCARHVATGGALVAGFQLGRGYELTEYDDDCRAAGLTLAERFATWDRDSYPGDSTYAVSVHRADTA